MKPKFSLCERVKLIKYETPNGEAAFWDAEQKIACGTTVLIMNVLENKTIDFYKSYSQYRVFHEETSTLFWVREFELESL